MRITRADWEDGAAVCLSKGRAGNARVWRVETADGAFAVKDFRKSPWWIRWTWGRWMVGHEYRLMRRLEGLGGIPQRVFRVDAFAFGMELLPGVSLGDLNQANLEAEIRGDRAAVRRLPGRFFRDLERLVCAMHRRGVAHLDTRNAKNVMVLPGDRPALIDFQSGVRMWGWFPRWVRRLLCLSDLSSVYKHYYRFYYDVGTGDFAEPADGFPPGRARLFMGLLRLRRFWVFKGYSFVSRRKPKDYELVLVRRFGGLGGGR